MGQTRTRLHKATWWGKYWKVCKDPNCPVPLHVDVDIPESAIKRIPEIGESVVEDSEIQTLRV